MILGILFLSIASKGQSLGSIPASRATGNYANTNYINNNKIPQNKFTYSSNAPSLNDKPLSNLFDTNDLYWASNLPNNETFTNNLYINFDSPTELEAIIVDPTYRTNTQTHVRSFEGFPLIMKVYSSYGNRPFELQATFTGKVTVDDNWAKTQFVFKRSFKCEKLKIEFTDVSELKFWVSSPKKSPSFQRMTFIGAVNHFNMPIEPLQSDLYTNGIESTAFDYDSTPSKSDHPISYAFDNIQNTYWISENENTDEFKNSITVTFKTQTKLAAISLYALFSTNKNTGERVFSGFPFVINAYTSTTTQDLKIHTVFSGSPEDDWDHVQMVFKNPIYCKTLKLEFVSVSSNAFASNKCCPGAHSITFYSHEYDEIPYIKNDYADNYINANKVLTSGFTYRTDGGSFDKYALSNMFDGNWKGTYWIAQYANDTFRPSVYIDFKEPVSLESLYMYNAFSSDHGKKTRRFDGAPTILKVFTALYNTEDYELKAVFTGNPGNDYYWDGTKFPFKTPLHCQRLKIEFTEVTNNPLSGAPSKAPYIGELMFIKSYTSIPDEINGQDPSDYCNSSSYIDKQKVQINPDQISASSSANNHDISKAFDNNPSTYWKAADANSKASITITFNSLTAIDAIIIRPSNSELTGFPVLTNLYGITQRGTSNLQFIAKLSRQSQPSAEGSSFVFSSPLQLLKLTLEFDQIYPLSSKKVIPEVSEIILLKEPSQVSPPSESGGDIIASDDACNQKYRCDQHISEEVKTTLVVQKTQFTEYKSDTNGGAINLINCGFKCTGGEVKFENCLSREGGGAISFKDDFSVDNSFYISDAEFKNCKAVYGGAIYIYTANDNVTIMSCKFENTQAEQSSNGSPFYGGSALFLTYNEGTLSGLRFNQMSGNIVKIYNNFDVQPSSKLLDQKKTISISHCTFNTQKNTESSIYYVRGNGNSVIKVSECDFIGKLRKGFHHIDGQLISNVSPKMLLTSCRFSSDSNTAFDLSSNNEFLSADLKDQVFNFKFSKDKHKANTNIYIAFIVSACMAIAALITLIIFVVKKPTTEQSDVSKKSEDEEI